MGCFGASAPQLGHRDNSLALQAQERWIGTLSLGNLAFDKAKELILYLEIFFDTCLGVGTDRLHHLSESSTRQISARFIVER